MRNYAAFVIMAGLTTFVGCGSMSSDMSGAGMGAPSGEFGATQGGVQDMTFARELVEAGRVPPADAFVVEAMFSEHDLPLEGEPCATALCLRAAMGIAPDHHGNPAAWTQIGMSSTIDPESFERPSLALVATVDVSGSMGWSYGSQETTPASISRALLHAVAGQLHEGDRFAMVTYGSSTSQPLTWTAGGDPTIAQSIDGLHEGGATNMEAGLKLAYEVAAQAKGTADEVRVMLLTDVQPNVGATTATEFAQIAGNGANEHVGLTVFGVGLGMGAEVMKGMSGLRGGNAFSVMSPASVPAFMDDNWPWLASPIAYNLKLNAEAAAPLTLSRTYGFPGDDTASLEVATVFLSKRRGGMLLELTPQGELEGGMVSVQLSYEDSQGEQYGDLLFASYGGQSLDDRGRYLPGSGLSRSVPLALLVTAMHDAAVLYETDHSAAIALLEPAISRFAQDAEGDAELQAEAEFWPRLLDLMKQGAPSGSLYGQ